MARSLHVSVLRLAAILLALTLTLTLGASPSAAQRDGFQSINCGGEAYTDSNNNIIWEADPFNKYNSEVLYGKSSRVNSSLIRNMTNAMTSLRYFRSNLRNTKFCYSLEVFNGSTYLLRASFLYGNYDGLNEPPTFVIIFNYDEWRDVNTSSSTTPIVHELIFVSKAHSVSICLAPHINSTHTPFISSLEIRRLAPTMYALTGGALSQGHGLMLWQRISYGARTNMAIRYPDDEYDRIWEANTTGTVVRTSSRTGSVYDGDPEEPPAEVMSTAITTKDSNGNLSFTYQGFGGVGQFRIEMHLQDPVENATTTSARILGLEFPHSQLILPEPYSSIPISSRNPIYASFDNSLELPMPLQIKLFPNAASPRGPLLNAIELFHWTSQPLSATLGTFQGDVDAIHTIQKYFKLEGSGQGDPCMPQGYAWTWVTCNNDTIPRITEINLATFNLTGDIPQSINNLTNLQKIDLSNNKLTGQIPDVSFLMDLKYLDLHNNNLSGGLPSSLLLLSNLDTLDVSYNNLCGSVLSFKSASINISYIGNNRVCNSSECQCTLGSISNSSTLSTSEKKSGNTKKYVFAIVFLGALYIVSAMMILLVIYKWRSQGKNSTARKRKGIDDPQGLPFVTKMFTYNEIRNATLKFTTILGEGGFGKVYHGLLPTGEAIAVKILADASKQGLKEFYNEVAILSRVSHKNLVSLIGYCVENQYMLIYEYIAKGSLRNLIYGDVESIDKPIPWTTRLHIALDASQGLEYLHTGCDPTIIHRDVKSSNILLTDKMQAKVADFGLSRFKQGDATISHVSTVNVVGTAGYLDPAYNSTNQLTDKSDVYSFGIVLFELVCGRAPIDMFTSPPHIVEWATQAIRKGKVEDIVDPMLANGYKVEAMWKVVDVAFGCVESDRLKRPKMSQVIQLLQNALEIEMDQNLPPQTEDVSRSSSTSDVKLPTLQYIESLQINLEPR